jgi:hypothetical protein
MSVERAELLTHPMVLPDYLQGLSTPATTEDALRHAESHGADADALAFIEALPAAVFSTEEGMLHAFASVAHHELPRYDPRCIHVAEDGDAS